MEVAADLYRERIKKERGVFKCVKAVCVLLGTIRGQVHCLTMAQLLLATGQYCGNRAPSSEAPGKDGGCREVLHCSCWMMGIICEGDAGFSFFFLKEVQSNILSGQAETVFPLL